MNGQFLLCVCPGITNRCPSKVSGAFHLNRVCVGADRIDRGKLATQPCAFGTEKRPMSMIFFFIVIELHIQRGRAPAHKAIR